MRLYGARITGMGAHLPSKVIENAELEAALGVSQGWILERTGIQMRRYAGQEELASEFCVNAALDLAQRHGLSLDDVDLVIAGSMSPDCLVPGIASTVQDKLGLASAGAFDLNAACSSFVYALQLANSVIISGAHRKVLIVCGDIMSRLLDPGDRGTVAVFGDGAAAVLVERTPVESSFFQNSGSDGSGASLIRRVDAKLSGEVIDLNLRMKGPEVFRWVLQTIPNAIQELLDASGLNAAEIDWFVPHSANARMLDLLCEAIGFPTHHMITSLECYGNTGAASIPLALVAGMSSGRLRQGDKVLLFGFGAGLTYAGCVFDWALPASEGGARAENW